MFGLLPLNAVTTTGTGVVPVGPPTPTTASVVGTLTIDLLPQIFLAVAVLVPSSAAEPFLHFGTAFVSNFMFFGKSTTVRFAFGGSFEPGGPAASSLFCVSMSTKIFAGLYFFFGSFFG